MLTGKWRRINALKTFPDQAAAYTTLCERFARNPDVTYRLVPATRFFVMGRDLSGAHQIPIEAFSNHDTAEDFVRLRAAKLNVKKDMYKIVEVNE
jgi:hypothetical protein